MINKIKNLFSNKDNEEVVLHPDEYYTTAKKNYNNMIKNQDVLLDTIHMLIETLDTQEIIAAWRKDEHDKYIFANQVLRKDLFNSAALTKIIGKTDNELILGEKIDTNITRQMIHIKPSDLPNIQNFLNIDGSRICNVTDIITRVFKRPCFFIENLSDKLCLAVKKYPIIASDCKINGTIGYYVNIAHDRAYVNEYIKKAIDNKKAYRIDGVSSYYIEEPMEINIEARCFLKGIIEK